MLIFGFRDSFKRIPLEKDKDVNLPGNWFHKHSTFGIVIETEGKLGDRVWECNMYKVEVGAQVEYKRGKFLKYEGNLPKEMSVEERKLFKESELKKGFLSQNMKEVLEILARVVIPAAEVAAGL